MFRWADYFNSGKGTIMKRVALVTMLFLMVCGVAQAQPLADRLPADTMVYVGWAGCDSLADAYDQSKLKKLYATEDGEAESIGQVIAALAPVVAQEEPELARMLPKLGQIVDASLEHPGAIAIGIRPQPGRDPMPRFAWIIDAGADAQAVHQQFEELLNDIRQQSGEDIPLALSRDGNQVWLTFDMGPVTNRADSLAAKPGFIKSFNAQIESPAIWAQVDCAGIIGFIDQMVVAESGAESYETEQWRMVHDMLGIQGLREITLTAGFHGADWRSELFVHAPAPRTGVLAVIESSGRLSPEALASIPETASIAGGFQIDISKLYAWVYDMVGEMEPEGQQAIDQGIAQAGAMLGVDVKAALIDGIGSDWVYYADRNVGGNGVAGVVIRNQLRDPQAAMAIERLLTIGNMIMQQELGSEDLHLAIKPFQHGDHTVYYLNSPLISPALSVDDNQLLIGLYPQTVVSALDQQKTARSITDNPKFNALRRQLSVGPEYTGFHYVDTEQTLDSAYSNVLMMNRLYLGLADMMGIQTDPLSIPPIQKLRPLMSPIASFSWIDKDGFHMRSHEPFPGSSMYGAGTSGQTTIGAAALAGGIMLPALNRAREVSYRTASAANTRSITQACLIYSMENGGAFPGSLGELVAERVINPRVLFHPNSGKKVPPHLTDINEIAAWCDANTDYVYLGGSNRLPGDALVVYERIGPSWTREGIAMAFGDGHAEWVKLHEAKQLIKEDKRRRANWE